MMHRPWDCAHRMNGCRAACGYAGAATATAAASAAAAAAAATTGGGDWGSSGSFDASGFNAGGDLGAWAGTAYDASTAGTGAGGGGDWGSFGADELRRHECPQSDLCRHCRPQPWRDHRRRRLGLGRHVQRGGHRRRSGRWPCSAAPAAAAAVTAAAAAAACSATTAAAVAAADTPAAVVAGGGGGGTFGTFGARHAR